MIWEPRVTLPVPETDLLSYLFSTPPENSDEKVLVDADNPTHGFTWLECRSHVRRIAAGFTAIGVKPGDCLVTHSRNEICTLLLSLACVAVGAVSTTTFWISTEQELVHQLQACGASWVIAEPEFIPLITSVASQIGIPASHIIHFDLSPVETLPSDVKTYRSLLKHGEQDWVKMKVEGVTRETPTIRFLTSGSTGRPKAAEHSQYSALASAIFAERLLKQGKTKFRMLYSLPVSHITATSFFRASFAANVVFHLTSKDDAVSIISLIEQHNISCGWFSPRVLTQICELVESGSVQGSTVKSLQYILAGGAPVSRKLVTRLQAILGSEAVVQNVYGATEAPGIMSVPYPQMQKGDPLSVGYNSDGVRVKLYSPGGEIFEPDRTGEIAIQTPILFSRYYQNPEATKGAFVTSDDGTWWRTGDLGHLSSEHGEFVLTGRCKEVFKVRYEEVSPAELEDVLCAHPSISDAAVGPILPNGTTDPLEVVAKAWIVKNTGCENFSAADVLNYLSGKVAEHKLPTGGVVFVARIPRNPTGKIMRGKLEFL